MVYIATLYLTHYCNTGSLVRCRSAMQHALRISSMQTQEFCLDYKHVRSEQGNCMTANQVDLKQVA